MTTPVPNPILGDFDFEDLQPIEQAVCKPIYDLAHALNMGLPDGNNKDIALEALLDVRASALQAFVHPDTII